MRARAERDFATLTWQKKRKHKKNAKKAQNILSVQKIAVLLHPLSRENVLNYQKNAKKSKKMQKNFGSSKKSSTFAVAFALNEGIKQKKWSLRDWINDDVVQELG